MTTRTPPSIPSRYQTLIHTDPLQPKAFNSTTKRFEPYSTDLPAPNYYRKERADALLQSTNLPAYASFVSKGNRFDRKRLGNVAVGPGSYSIQSTEHTTMHSSPAFMKPIATSHHAQPQLPGPGQYTLPEFKTSSTIIIKNHQYSATTTTTTPSPGHYTLPSLKNTKMTGIAPFKASSRNTTLGKSIAPGPASFKHQPIPATKQTKTTIKTMKPNKTISNKKDKQTDYNIHEAFIKTKKRKSGGVVMLNKHTPNTHSVDSQQPSIGPSTYSPKENNFI